MKRKIVTMILLDLLFYCGGLTLTASSLFAVYGILSVNDLDMIFQVQIMGWRLSIPLGIWIVGIIVGTIMFIGRFLLNKFRKKQEMGTK